MRYTYMLLIIAGLAIKQETYAQNYAVDALRFSQYQFGSSARLKALANAQTAVGGDISSIGGNPAGIGLFTRSEFSLTTEVMRYSSESNYLNQSTNASRGRLDINNAGAVFVMKLAKPKGQDLSTGALSLNFGIGYNKTNDFGNKLRFSGTNPQNSIANFYADLGNGYTGALVEGSLEDAAEQARLIVLNNNNYASNTNTANRVQDEVIIRNGSQSELNLTTGINIGNTFFIGASVGLLGLNYSSNNTFTETGSITYSDNTTDKYTANYYQTFRAKGYGYNLKLGAIFRPSPFFRIGANIQSPNWYTIDDTYSESNKTRLSDNPAFEDLTVQSQPSVYDFTYGLRTPARFSVGAALFENKIGFITGEIELVDYSTMELESKDYTFPNEVREDNQYIVNNYGNATNFKIGAEIKAASPFLIRGGYSFTQSPIQDTDMDLDVHMYSIGGGFRMGNVNIDLAYQTSSMNSQTSPYILNSGSQPVAISKSTRGGFFITIGTRF